MKRFMPVLLILLLASTAMAQNKSRIVGTVNSPEAGVITGVTVTISSDALIARSQSTMTNERGAYRFVLLPIGTYSIKFEKSGYKTVERSGIELGFDSTATINQILTPADFSEVVTISGEAPLVDKTSSSITAKLDTSFLQNQPNTRDVWDMPNRIAGYNDDSGMGGVQSAGNVYHTDGINVSDPATKTVFSDINMEAVEQVDVNLFGANAEYGSFTGAAINVITKSGGNEFSGEVNYFARRLDWTSDNTENFPRIAAPVGREIDNPNFALGGPVLQDKVWFFANYNMTRETIQRSLVDQVYQAPEDTDRAFLKLSGRWDDRNLSQASYTYYKLDRDARAARGTFAQNRLSSLWKQVSESDTYLLQHSFVVNDDLILEGRYAGFRGGFDLIPRNGTVAPSIFDNGLGQHLPGSNANRQDLITRDRDDFLLTANYFVDDLNGTHSFKAGFGFGTNLNARSFSYTDLQTWVNGVPVQKTDNGAFEGGRRLDYYSGFVQDSWTVSPRLTINAGFRIDSNAARADDPSIAPVGDATIYRLNDPAWRFGAAYDLMGDGKTILRGFVGRYYEGVVAGNIEPLVTTYPATIVYAWNAGLQDWVVTSITGGSGNTFVEDDFSNAYSDGVSLGIEHALTEDLAASLTYVFKHDSNMVGSYYPGATWNTISSYSFSNANGSYSGVYYRGFDPGSDEYVGNPKKGITGVLGDPERNFHAVSAEVNKRMSDNWTMKASYTWTRNTGFGFQDSGTIQSFEDGYSNPNNWINAEGRLELERVHTVKLTGTYIAPFDIYISPAFTWFSGQPYDILHSAGGDPDAIIRIKPMDGEDRYDSQFNIDLRVEKAFIFAERYRLGLLMDVFNLTNDDAVTAFLSRRIESSNFLVPSTLVPARFYQVGVRLIF